MREGYCSCPVCVCVCVCVSVKSHLASGASVRPENAVTYSVDNVGRKICGIFSETALFQSYGTSCIAFSALVLYCNVYFFYFRTIFTENVCMFEHIFVCTVSCSSLVGMK